MASNHSLDRNKGKLSDIKTNIEAKKAEVTKLEEQKQALLDAGTEIQGSDQLDEKAKASIMEELQNSLEENSEKGEELSSEMNTDFQEIEEMKQETQDAMAANQKERSRLESTKSLLDRFGLGDHLEEGISELDDNMSEEQEFNDSLMETEKEAQEVASRLGAV